jgi:hypothetical protein
MARNHYLIALFPYQIKHERTRVGARQSGEPRMVELYFLFYRIPKMMTKLARERNRSALAWSFLAIGAWIGAELVVFLTVGIAYGTGSVLFGWQQGIPPGLNLFSYLAALAAAIGSVTLLRRILSARPAERAFPAPPPPPEF